jgi:transposase-like protein
MAMAKSVGKNVAMGRLRRDGDKERAWRKRIAEQQRGKDSVREFCRKLGLHEASFYRWRKEIRLRDRQTADNLTPPALAPVVVIDEPQGESAPSSPSPSSTSTPTAIDIVLGDGTTVRVPPGSTREQLATVFSILEPARC